MKKLLLFIVYTAVFISVFPRAYELKERAIVQAVGIDMQGENFYLTVLYYSPSSAGGENTAQTDASAEKCVSASADTLEGAFGKISSKTGKINYYGHNSIIVIGRDALKTGAQSIFSYINSNSDLLADIDLLASETTALDILTADTDESMLPSSALAKITQTAKDGGSAPQDSCIDIMNAFVSADTDVLIPSVRLVSEQGGNRSYSVSGAAVLHGGKYLRELSEKNILGYNLLSGNSCSFFVSTQLDNTDINVKIYSSKEVDSNGQATICCTGAVSDITPVKSGLSSEDSRTIEMLAGEKIEAVCNDYLYDVQTYNINPQGKLKDGASGAVKAEVDIDVYKSVKINT